MATAVSVLCARVRMEEKWLIEALAAAGVPARQLPPTASPLPVGPVPPGPFATLVAGGVAAGSSEIVVDRCADRVIAKAVVPAMRAMGSPVIDAGLAATGDRLAIATALATAGVPRPRTFLAASDDAGLEALRQLGFPATLLPLDPGAVEIPFLDRDIAEAVLEHRQVLGVSQSTVSLVQAGSGLVSTRVDLLVVDGRVAGMSGSAPVGVVVPGAFELAESAASVLGARLIGVSIVLTADGPVVWDVQPVPEYRAMTATTNRSIAESIADLVASFFETSATPMNGSAQHVRASEIAIESAFRRGVGDGIVLSA